MTGKATYTKALKAFDNKAPKRLLAEYDWQMWHMTTPCEHANAIHTRYLAFIVHIALRCGTSFVTDF